MYKKFAIFDSDSLKNIYKRIFFSIAVFSISFLLIYFQIFNIMIFSKYYINPKLSFHSNLDNKIERGSIYDRNGILLARTIESYSLFTNPQKIKNPDILSNKLEKILSIPKNKILSELNNKSKVYKILFN